MGIIHPCKLSNKHKSAVQQGSIATAGFCFLTTYAHRRFCLVQQMTKPDNTQAFVIRVLCGSWELQKHKSRPLSHNQHLIHTITVLEGKTISSFTICLPVPVCTSSGRLEGLSPRTWVSQMGSEGCKSWTCLLRSKTILAIPLTELCSIHSLFCRSSFSDQNEILRPSRLLG